MFLSGLSFIIPPLSSPKVARRRNDPAKHRAAISENIPQVTISKELKKVTFSIMAQGVRTNVPLFLTTGSALPPAAS